MTDQLNILIPEVFLSLSIFSILMFGVFTKKSFNIVFNLSFISFNFNYFNNHKQPKR